MGEGRTASWTKLWIECPAGRGGVSVCLTLHMVYSALIVMSAGAGGAGWGECLFNLAESILP